MEKGEYHGLSEIFAEALAMPLPDVDRELVASGLLDSMALVSLVVEIETKFEIEIADEDLVLASFNTVRGMAEMVRRSRQARMRLTPRGESAGSAHA
jgi:acyl carrier protein